MSRVPPPFLCDVVGLVGRRGRMTGVGTPSAISSGRERDSPKHMPRRGNTVSTSWGLRALRRLHLAGRCGFNLALKALHLAWECGRS
jgi:hypothetical protein